MPKEALIAAVGDVHGHLQLALCVLARWQQQLGREFDAVLLCGDVGTFTNSSQLDTATRAYARSNPCELEFLWQWAVEPQPPWIQAIFTSTNNGGLGLKCPVIMVHGNHEGFTHLKSLVHDELPTLPVSPSELPTVDSGGHIKLLPSGWRVRLSGGTVVAAIGGIQPGQRRTSNHSMAYIDPQTVEWLLEGEPVDVLITHQGPAVLQQQRGAKLLDPLAEREFARVWFHGHSILVSQVSQVGPNGKTVVVPLADIVFHVPKQRPQWYEPYEVGLEGWALASISPDNLWVKKEPPEFYRDYRRQRWIKKGRMLVCPDLAKWVEGV